MGFASRLLGCSLTLVTFVIGAVPPNMLTTYFNTQYVKPGFTARERCDAKGDPTPTYIWKKDGVILSNDGNYEINPVQGNITIKSVTVVNGEGTYQCFAQNSQGTALSGFWEVKVASLSGFEQSKINNQAVNEYSYFSMRCEDQPSSVPASATRLDWLAGNDENTAFPMTAEDKRRIVLDADGTLHFLFVRASDQSNNPYRCQLLNPIARLKAVSMVKFNLNVQRVSEVTYKPTLKYSKRVEGTVGSRATLLCIFAGNPIPNVEWLKDGVRLPDGSLLPHGKPRYRIDPEDSTGRKLLIDKLEMKDEGNYICRATNTYGMNEGTVRVTVTGPPQWSKGPLKSTRIPAGATAKLQCDTVSYRATSSLPMWMKNGEPLIGCGVRRFWCGDGTGCYDYNKKCNNRNDCPGNPSVDEQNCPALDTCLEGQFSCGGSECKPAADVVMCDGNPQCQNGGDESVRHCGCNVNTDFMCADLRKCVSASQRCDKHADCDDGSDEKRCAYDPEKVIDNKFHFSADLRQLTIPNVKKTDTMCLQCLVYNFREYGPNPKPDIVGITFEDACITVLDPINILTGLPEKQKLQPGDIINFTISAQTDALEQGNLRYDWYIGGKKYPEQFTPLSDWFDIIKLSMGNTRIVIDTSSISTHEDKKFRELMGNLSLRVYHKFDQRIISTDLYTEIIIPPHNATTAPSVLQRSDIECQTTYLKIFIPKHLVPANGTATWRDSGCVVHSNGTHFVDSIGLRDCGTTLTFESDSVVFENELIFHKNGTLMQNGNNIVSYGSDYEFAIPVKCVYPRNSNISTSYIPIVQQVKILERRNGQLDLTMRQYEAEDYHDPVPFNAYPRQVPLNNDIFIRLAMENNVTGLGLSADNCFATSSPSPVDPNWYQLISSGCPVNNAKLHPSGTTDVKFSFHAFNFRHNTSGIVYVHCQVSLCLDTDPACVVGCMTRKKRSTSAREGSITSDLISTGPFILTTEEGGLNTSTVVAAVSIAAAVIATIVAVIGWTRKSKKTVDI